MENIAIGVSNWSKKWFPEAYVFAALAVVVVVLAAMAMGVPLASAARGFGDGYWSLIPFTMQMALVAISGYIVAVSPPAAKLIMRLAALPRGAKGAVVLIAAVSLGSSLFNWAISLVFSGLLEISGVIPFTDTIVTWQSLLMMLILIIISLWVAYLSAPTGARIRTAADLGVDLTEPSMAVNKPQRPGEWLEYSPLVTLLLALLSVLWLYTEFTSSNPILVIFNLNTYNFLFLTLGMILCWRPIRFIRAFSKAVPSVAGVLIQFPLYGGIAFIMTKTANADGETLSHLLASGFVSVASSESYAAVMGIYSAVLGFFIPSGGGKWLIEAPYVLQAANELRVNLGWAVQVYNAAEARPNLINPFWMLPLLGVLGLRARDIVGFTFTQLIVHLPLVLLLLWLFTATFHYVPPMVPAK
ncbi:TIGR00366 family protein [Candidatus Sodalis pierantonius]|uniref:TIGR00366 family protein n=1 Tax=Candidatus Sodalis pierantonii TaxID=1486991 RepID=UPI00046D0FAE|nr:TIGR00366 family protein [Candidatus Sodalis pierantonius]